MHWIITATTILLLPLTAAANPFASGDPAVGKNLHDAKCISCHQGMVGGDGSDIYRRVDRKIETPQALRQQIATCNKMANAGWSPKDEEHTAAYLNQQYYKFK